MFLESQNTYMTTPLADLCSKIGSGATPKGGKAAYFDKGISLIRSMNVFDYFFSYPELAHISQIQANALANVDTTGRCIIQYNGSISYPMLCSS